MKYVSVCLALVVACWCENAFAANVEGVWATDARYCDKVFVKNGSSVSFAEDGDLYGSGFIIEGRKIRGKVATCTIKNSTEDGSITHLIAACATDVMLSNVQLSVKIVDQNKLIRLFPGMSGMEIPYERCTL